MKDMVVVPLHKRAAFAWAALTCLDKAADDDVAFHLILDFGHDPLVLELANRFALHMGQDRVTVTVRKHTYRGNSYNLLLGYTEVMDCGADLIHMVEEDVLVANDYFTFHRDAHQTDPGAFCVSACRNQQYAVGTEPPKDDTAVYRHGSYQSLGVSFRPDKLKEVAPHVQRNYFLNPVAYCKVNFPQSVINPAHAEQDGLIHRIIEQAMGYTVYPCVPRAYHAGFVGYHRKGAELPGTPEQQARQILQMTAADFNAHARDYKDHDVVDRDAKRKPVSKVIEWP